MERAPNTEPSIQPVWCVVANVVAEPRYGPGGVEVRRGTRLLAPGAKVYCSPVHYDPDRLIVVGRHRASHRYATLVVRQEWLTNWRIELAYSPHVIREMRRVTLEWLPDDATEDRRRQEAFLWDGTPEVKERAEQSLARTRVSLDR